MSRASALARPVLLLFFGVFSACGGGGGSTPPPAAPSTFALQVSPGSLQIPAGGSGYVTVSVSRLNGFVGPIAFTGLGFPAGSRASGVLPDGSTSLALPIAVSGTVAPATFSNLTIEGRSGSIVQTAPFALTVGAPLAQAQLSEDALQASGGRQGAGTVVNVVVVQEPLRATKSANPSGTVQVRHGFLPLGSPLQP